MTASAAMRCKSMADLRCNMETLRWQNGQLILLDQTKLPLEEAYIHCTTWRDVYEAISRLAVRGAPAIGVAAAYGAVLAAKELSSAREYRNGDTFFTDFSECCCRIDKARPTAVNLHWALEQMKDTAWRLKNKSVPEIIDALEDKALALQEEDLAINTALSEYGANELSCMNHSLTILTHCNAGALATAGVGTALGVVRSLHKRSLITMVYADETRPLLQGARLTVSELMADGIPVTLITDNMAAWVMKTWHIDAVIVGADRIAENGDTANKIGTYGVSILAKEHGIPFYVAAPISTFDLSVPSGIQIPIEERNHDEVRFVQGIATALPQTPVFNPAFDVTPHENITAIFTEKGIIHKPDRESICSFFNSIKKQKGSI